MENGIVIAIVIVIVIGTVIGMIAIATVIGTADSEASIETGGTTMITIDVIDVSVARFSFAAS